MDDKKQGRSWVSTSKEQRGNKKQNKGSKTFYGEFTFCQWPMRLNFYILFQVKLMCKILHKLCYTSWCLGEVIVFFYIFVSCVFFMVNFKWKETLIISRILWIFCGQNRLTVTLLVKLEKDITRKEDYRLTFLINLDVKIFNKVLANGVQQSVKKILSLFLSIDLWI